MGSSIVYTELVAQGINAGVAGDIDRLLPQLTSGAPLCTKEGLVDMLHSGTRLFVAVDGGRVIGTVLLCQVVGIAGKKDWIEDVITDEEYRGRGVSSQLMDMAEEASRLRGSKSINLTSNPARVSAWKMYANRGYKMRETGMFRKVF